jgi:hypothetical protein
VLVGLPQGVGGLGILFHLFLDYSYNTHQVLGGLPRGVGGLGNYYILYYIHFFKFNFITRARCSWDFPKGLVASLFYFISFRS